MTAASTATTHFDAPWAETPEHEPGEVVARWRDGIFHPLLRELGASILEAYDDHSVTVIRVTPGREASVVDALLQSPEHVVWAQANYVRRAQAISNDPLFPQQWGMQKIQALAAWDVTLGSPSVIVAIVDTGVDLSHPDLQGRIVDGRNFLDPDQPPQDDGGHGTHVAGTIAASLNNSLGIAGIAPGVSIMPVKALTADGRGRDSTVAASMRWAIDNGARIVNMSFSLRLAEVSPVLTEAVAYAESRNVLLVVAAGNDGSSSPTFPAATDPVISVAATDENDRRAFFSNYGEWITVSAPGTGIMSTTWDGNSNYGSESGTSMAAAHVTGVAALMISLRPELGVSEVKALLRASSDPLPDFGMGGRLNAAKAVNAVGRPAAPPPSLPTPAPVAPLPVPAAPPPIPESRAPSTARARALAYNTPSPATTVYVPVLVRNADGWTSQIVIMNTAGAPVSATARLLEPAGSSPASLTATLPAYASVTLDLSVSQFLPQTWEGSAVISADGPVVAVATMTRPGSNSIAFDGRPSGAQVAYAPLIFKNRNGWNTTVFIQNLGAETATVQLLYSGTGLAVSTTEVVTIPPSAARRISQAESAALPDNFDGSLMANSTRGQPIALVVIERNVSGNAAAYTSPIPAGTGLVAPVIFKNRATNGVWNTGIQIQNLGGDVAQVTLTYRRSDGPVGQTMVDRSTINPGASRTFYQPSTDALPNGFVGSATISVENGQLISGLVNEVNYDRNVSSTYQLLGSGQPTIYAPLLLRNSDGLSSGLQVQNLGSRPANVVITYRSQAGAILVVQSDTIDPSAARTYFQPTTLGLPDGFVGSATLTSDGGQPLAAIVNAVAY